MSWEEIYKNRLGRWGTCAEPCVAQFIMRNFGGDEVDRTAVRVLDVGCSVGAQSKWIFENGFTVDGIDVSKTAIDTAMGIFGDPGAGSRARFHVADVASIPFADNTFDAAVDVCCLQHVEDVNVALDQIKRVLKPGGKILSMIATPDHYKLTDDLKSVPFRTMSFIEVMTAFGNRFENVVVDAWYHTDRGKSVSHWVVKAEKK